MSVFSIFFGEKGVYLIRNDLENSELSIMQTLLQRSDCEKTYTCFRLFLRQQQKKINNAVIAAPRAAANAIAMVAHSSPFNPFVVHESCALLPGEEPPVCLEADIRQERERERERDGEGEREREKEES